MKRFATWLFVLGLVFAPIGADGQEVFEEDNPIVKLLFEPELIMQHRRAIDLTDEQRDAISQMIQELQGRVVSLQWDLLDEIESLNEALERPRIDLDLALDRMENVLETEKEIKQTHLELLIRIKNVLRPDQQAELARLRERGAGGEA